MADPKYSNLPYISKGQPDIYETSDLPESDQSALNQSQEEADDVVERLAVDPKEAYDKFKNTVLTSDRLDFSGSCVTGPCPGYDARTEYEILGSEDRAKELPLHRYQRIKYEVKDLLDSLSQPDAEKAAGVGNQSGVSKAQLVSDLDKLHHQLSKLPLVASLGSAEGGTAEATDSPQYRSLLTELQRCNSPPKKGKAKESSATGAPAPGHITYELYCQPQVTQGTQETAELEKRLHRLESVLGLSEQGQGQLLTLTGENNLMRSVNVLNTRLSLVSGEELDRVEGRLSSLNERLDQVLDKKKQVQQTAQESARVKELYEMVKKWDEVVDVLPAVTERLVSLEHLHQQVMQFMATLKHLDLAQEEIKRSLGGQQEALSQVSNTFSKNVEVLQKNCSLIEKRLKAVGK